MNRIFSKIWSKSLGRMVVASELASRKGCSTGRRPVDLRPQRPAALANSLLGVMAVTGCSVALPAMAQQQGIYINGGDSDSCTHVRADLAGAGNNDEVGLSAAFCGYSGTPTAIQRARPARPIASFSMDRGGVRRRLAHIR